MVETSGNIGCGSNPHEVSPLRSRASSIDNYIVFVRLVRQVRVTSLVRFQSVKPVRSLTDALLVGHNSLLRLDLRRTS